MTFEEALSRADKILRAAKVEADRSNFLVYADAVADVVRDYTPRQRIKRPWLREWAETWAKLYGDFEREVARDPMMLYKPKNPTALAFHQSEAFVRYACLGEGSFQDPANRTVIVCNPDFSALMHGVIPLVNRK